MKRIGLTGGIACGKSEVSHRLETHGIPVLDTDQLAHSLLKKEGAAVSSVRRRFGEHVLQSDGGIDRKKLGDIVFTDEQSRKDVNSILHPMIIASWRDWLKKQCGPMAIVAVPLLFEIGVQNDFDGILCVQSTEHLMLNRLLNRNLTLNQAQARIRSQWPVKKKAQQSTWTLTNNHTLSNLHRQVDDWVTMMIHEENE